MSPPSALKELEGKTYSPLVQRDINIKGTVLQDTLNARYELWGIYRESRDNGLNVSLTVSFHNGAETCFFKYAPTGAAVLNGRRRRGRRHEQREQHGRRGGHAQQAQNSGVCNANGKCYAQALLRRRCQIATFTSHAACD